MSIEIGKEYYFNNRRVYVLRLEEKICTPNNNHSDTQFAFVVAELNFNHDITGGNFCIACMTGEKTTSHQCEDAQEVIDILMSELGEYDVFWVNTLYLKETPFEYQPNLKLKEEIIKNQNIKEELRQELINIRKNIELIQAEQELESTKLENLKETNKKLEDENNNKEVHNNKLIESIKANADVEIDGMDMTISVKYLLELLESYITLELLRNGGVDNWEWYGESIGDCDPIVEALKVFRSLK